MPAAVVAGAAVVGSLISSQSASSAARTQANAIRDAAETEATSAAGARADILDTMVPALADYGRQMQESRNEIISGATDVMNILQNSTNAASGILDTTMSRASSALLGTSQPTRQAMPTGGLAPPTTGGIAGGIQTGEYTGGAPAALESLQAEANAAPTADQAANSAYQQVMSTLGPAPNPASARDNFESGLTQDYTNQRNALQSQAQAAAEAARTEATEAAAAQAAQAPTPGLTIDDPYSMDSMTGMPQPNMPAPAPGQPGGPALDIGFMGADQRLQEGLQGGLGALARGANMARGDITTGRDAALENMSAFSNAGRSAVDQEAALSGALGPEAQQQAINAYIESPGQKYLREQQEQALLRNSAATGGLGGGRVRTALQEQAMGIASTQQQQHLENLRSLATRGQQAAGTEANINTQSAAQLANIAQQLGMSAADLMRMNASERAQLAERTGINLAQLEQTIGQAQAGLASGLGAAQAGVRGATGADLAQLAEREGLTNLQSQGNISSQLANLATGSGSNIANLQAQGGAAQAAGTMASGQALAQGVTSLGNIAGYAMNSPTGMPQPNSTITSPNTYQNLTPINQPGPVHVGAGGTTAYGM